MSPECGGTVVLNGRVRWVSLVLAAVLISLLTSAATPALAVVSHDDLRARMLADLEAELPDTIRTIGFWYLENDKAPSLDIDLLREDLEIAIIQSGRFQFVNREMFDRALEEMTFCSDAACLVNPQFMQRFGRARGLDAVLYGQILDSSENYSDLADKDYFVTVQLKAISTSTSAIIWSKEITGLNVENIVGRIGKLPEEVSLFREETFAREVARLLAASRGVEEAGIRTVLFLQFDDLTGSYGPAEMTKLYRALSNTVVQQTSLKLLDRDNLERMLEEQQMVIENLVDPSRRSDIGQLYGVDAFVFGRIREVEPQSITCAIRISDVETNVDVDAQIITSTSRNPELKLVNLLLNAGPSHFDSAPQGAEVFLADVGAAMGTEKRIGLTPTRYQLGHTEYSIRFHKSGYEDVTKRVRSRYGQAQRVFVDLGAVPCVLTITSEPSGAVILLDGLEIGETPLRAYETTWGSHRLEVQKPLYEPVAEALDFPAGEFSKHYDLRPTFGSLAVRTEPVTRGWIELDGERIEDPSPTTLAQVPIGSHRVAAKRCDCEGGEAEVSIKRGVTESITLALQAKTRGKALLRSALFPGLGQHYKNQHGRAWIYHLATLGGAALAIHSHTERESYIDDYEEARDLYGRAVAEEDINRYYQEMEAAYDDYESADQMRTIGAAAVGAVWLINVVDAALGWPLSCQDRPDGSLTVLSGTQIGLLAEQAPGGSEVRLGLRAAF